MKTNTASSNSILGMSQNNFLITENPQPLLNINNNLDKCQKSTLNNTINNSSGKSPTKNLLTTNIFICQGKKYNSLKQLKIGTDYKIDKREKKYYIPIMLKLNEKEKEIETKKKQNILPYITGPKIPQNLYSIYRSFNSTKNNSNNNNFNSNDTRNINNNSVKNNKINYINDDDYLDKVVQHRKVLKDQIIHRYKIIHGNHGFKYFFNNENNKKNKKENFWQKSLNDKDYKNVRVSDEIKSKIIGYDKIFFKFRKDEDEFGDESYRSKYNRSMSQKKDDANCNYHSIKLKLK